MPDGKQKTPCYRQVEVLDSDSLERKSRFRPQKKRCKEQIENERQLDDCNIETGVNLNVIGQHSHLRDVIQ